jgi:excisionase family DNA binding protein
MASDAPHARGLTVREVAKLLRISKDRIRSMIQRGELGALNVAAVRSGRPRFVVLPHHLAAFEQSRTAGPPPKATPRRKRRPPNWIDFYPD